jgi:hypothetical protein
MLGLRGVDERPRIIGAFVERDGDDREVPIPQLGV